MLHTGEGAFAYVAVKDGAYFWVEEKKASR